MPDFKFSVNNGHYKAGQTVELSIQTAKAFQNLKWGEIVTEEEKPKKKRTSKKN